MPKDAYYFKHDANASSDIKLRAVRKHFGWQGCGWFWFLIELLRSQDNYRLDYQELTFDALADDMACSPEQAKEYVDYCVEVKLLSKNGQYFYSQRLLRDMERLDNIRELRREAGLRSGEIRQGIKESSKENKNIKEHSILDHNTVFNKSSTQVEQKFNKSSINIPDFINKGLWDSFLEMRKRLRKPATPKAQELLLKDLARLKAEGYPPNEVLEQSIKNSYQGLFPLKGGQNGANRQNAKKGIPGNRPAGAFDDLDQN